MLAFWSCPVPSICSCRMAMESRTDFNLEMLGLSAQSPSLSWLLAWFTLGCPTCELCPYDQHYTMYLKGQPDSIYISRGRLEDGQQKICALWLELRMLELGFEHPASYLITCFYCLRSFIRLRVQKLSSPKGLTCCPYQVWIGVRISK